MQREEPIKIMFKSLPYTLKQAFKQIIRNINMCTASIFSITSMLLILGLFFIIVVNINMLAQSAQAQFDTIEIYLDDNLSNNAIHDINNTLKKIQGVKQISYVSKEKALEILKDRWQDNGYVLDGLESDIFPRSFKIKVNDLQYSDTIVEKLKGMNGIEEIKYYKSIVDKLLNITGFIQLSGMLLIAVLIIISIVIVANTVKLTVNAREREISIMKYIGATNWFIRGPFFVEGIVIGLIGAGISVAFINIGYQKIIENLGEQVLVMLSLSLVPREFLISNLIWIFMSLGVGIGSLGSILSMRKFLDT